MAARASCVFFAQGRCRNGAACPFSHDGEKPLCLFYASPRGCKNGAACPFRHEGQPVSNLPRYGQAADIVPLTTAEKAAVLHAIAQLDGKATQKKVRRAAESILGVSEGALDEKKAAVKEVCEDEDVEASQKETSQARPA